MPIYEFHCDACDKDFEQMTTMSARDLRRVRGLRSEELRALNSQFEDEVVHRDRLVLVAEEAE